MPGVFRPYSLADVLGTIQQQALGDTDTSVSGLGTIAEADESVTLGETVTATAQINPAWDTAQWGGFKWS
jgi:hypothetical protein